MQNLTKTRATELIGKCSGKTVAVVGDVMLDRYFWGSVSRISPEAPVPVIDLEEESFHLGGAANVANNLQSLGISPLLCGVIGDDNTGRLFSEIANTNGIDPLGLYTDKARPTTVKTRIIGNSQQIARLDREVRHFISTECEQFIINSLENTANLSGIIFEDYNKGTLTLNLIRQVIALAMEKNIPVFVDPKFDNFFEFKNVTVFKPNRKEAQQALGISIRTAEEIISAGNRLLEQLESESILLTLGQDGMMLFEQNGDISSVPTRARHVADVSGAGDTAIATLPAAIAGGATIKEAATLSNYASGVVCEEPGIVSITKDALFLSVERNSKG